MRFVMIRRGWFQLTMCSMCSFHTTRGKLKVRHRAGTRRSRLFFRKHEATFDFVRVENWVKVCMGLLSFAERADIDALKLYLLAHVEDKQYTLIDLLKFIDLDEQADYYENLGMEKISLVEIRGYSVDE